jgi:hypothetical protein
LKFQDFTSIFLAPAEHVFLLKLQDSIGIFRAMQNTWSSTKKSIIHILLHGLFHTTEETISIMLPTIKWRSYHNSQCICCILFQLVRVDGIHMWHVAQYENLYKVKVIRNSFTVFMAFHSQSTHLYCAALWNETGSADHSITDFLYQCTGNFGPLQFERLGHIFC